MGACCGPIHLTIMKENKEIFNVRNIRRKVSFVKLRFRSRSGEGQVRVSKVRVRSKSRKVKLRTQSLKIWT